MEKSITLNTERVGNFTSSQIYKLIKFGTREMTAAELEAYKKDNPKGTKKNIEGGFASGGLTYIEEKNMERRFNLSLTQEVYTKPMAWGKICEMYVHEKRMGIEYQSVGDKTLSHPTIDFWKGSPDFKNPSKRIIAECKAYERKNFAVYADAILKQDTEILKKDCPEEYWQMVSNACILEYDYIQPILFMPYLSELPDISLFAANLDDKEQWKYKFIFDAVESGNYASLPYLMDKGYYQNFISTVLEVPKADKEFLTERVLEAGKLLNPYWSAA